MRFRVFLIGVLALFIVFSAAVPVLAENYKGFERGEALITPGELHQKIQNGQENLVVLSVSRPHRYRMGHIPGSQNVWRPDFNASVGEPWPYGGMIENREDFQAFARNYGIDNNSEVVVYSHKYDATRLWWAFYLYGKKDVRVLDGGYQGWTNAGYEVDRVLASESPEKGNFVAESPKPGWRAQIGDVWRASNQSDWNLWDTRSDEEWTAKTVKGNATCAGRVPWANHLHWSHFKKKVNENAEQPTEFKDAHAVREVVEAAGIKPNEHQVFLCQSGVRTTTEIFSLYLLGYNPDKLHNYDGSWLEWSYHYCGNPVNERPSERTDLVERPSSDNSTGDQSIFAGFSTW